MDKHFTFIIIFFLVFILLLSLSCLADFRKKKESKSQNANLRRSYIENRNNFYQEIRNRYYNEQYDVSELVIDRNNLLESSFKEIMNLDKSKLLPSKKFKISFINEEGLDAGGPSREWFSLLMNEFFNPKNDLFYSPSEDFSRMIPVMKKYEEEKLIYYKFFGIILGRILVGRINVNIHCDDIVWKNILEIPCNDKDYEMVDPVFYKNFKIIEENPESGVDLPLEEDGIKISENSQDLIINNNTVSFHEYLKFKYTTKLLDKYHAIAEGISYVFPLLLIKSFSLQNLKLLINGTQNIDIENWKSCVKYINCRSSDVLIVWFWEIVNEFTLEDKLLLINFVTGSFNLPPEKFTPYSEDNLLRFYFVIQRNSTQHSNDLPLSSTCCKTLLLPDYNTKEIMKEKILYAIHECSEGFQNF